MEARHYVKWTPERDAELRSHFEAGKKDHEIAELMGIRAMPIEHRRVHLRLLRRIRGPLELVERWTPEITERMTKLWGEGHSAATIALDLGGGFTRSAIIGKAHRLKLPSRETSKSARRRKREARPKREHGGIWRRIDAMLADANKTAIDLPVDSSPFATTIEGLIDDRSQCRYPVTTPEGEPQLFCAADVVEGMPYCARHCAVCYNRKTRPYSDSSFQHVGTVALRVVDGLQQRLRNDNTEAA